MQLKVVGSKGGKDRYVPISPRLLAELGTYWKLTRPSHFLFPGQIPNVPLSSATIQKTCKLAAAQARITKRVMPHRLRHSYATGLLEAGVDCHDCHAEVPLYNSCGDRHCPQSRGARRADWVAQAAHVLHSAVTYFQVVFTLPAELSSLILGNRQATYRLLFQAAWQALRESIELECGYQPAATMMLHTWNQRLGHHPHVHALVAGNGPSLDGASWVRCRRTRGTRSNPARPFLVDNRRLSQRFRDRFLDGLRRLARRGVLRLHDGRELSVSSELAEQDWVVFVEGPPREKSSPEQVLKYLTRYMTGGPMGDRRLVGMDGERVTFLARAQDKSGRQVPVTMTRHEFLRNWCLHILPKGFTRVRWYGSWSSSRLDCQQASACEFCPDTTAKSVVRQLLAMASPRESAWSAIQLLGKRGADPVD